MTVSRPLELVLFYVAKLDVARNGLPSRAPSRARGRGVKATSRSQPGGSY